jgi:hypothetical protein
MNIGMRAKMIKAKKARMRCMIGSCRTITTFRKQLRGRSKNVRRKRTREGL